MSLAQRGSAFSDGTPIPWGAIAADPDETPQTPTAGNATEVAPSNSDATSSDSRVWSDLEAAYASVGKARAWFAEGVIEGKPFIILTAPEKGKKSWVAMQLAACVADSCETLWLGAFPVKAQGPVVYLDAEYGDYEFARRIARIARGLGAEPLDVLRRLRHRNSADLILSTEDRVFRSVVDEVTRNKPALIIIDPLRNHLAGDENDSNVIVKATRCIRMLQRFGGCPVMVLHHVNKSGKYSGSRALMGAADLILEGTDEADAPVYTARGRTVRPFDRAAQPFSVEVEHENDEDDTKAATHFKLVTQAGGGGRRKGALPAGLKPLQAKVLEHLRKQKEPRSIAYICKAVKRNRNDVENALHELHELGRAQERIGAVTFNGRTTDGWVGSTPEQSTKAQDVEALDVSCSAHGTPEPPDAESSLVAAA